MHVAQIWRHPIKSVAGERIADADVDELGIVGDRRLALRDRRTGLTLTARREPKLLFATPVVADDGSVLLALPDGTTTADPDVLAGWLNRDVELVAPDPDHRPTYEIAVDHDGNHQTAPDAATDRWAGKWARFTGPEAVFHDSTRTRVSIIATGSLGDWPVQRFRPNLVIEAADERDLLGKRLTIGDVVLEVIGEVNRCVVVTRPQPGIERDPDVLRTIHAERGGSLGVAAQVAAPGQIRESDRIAVS